MTNVRVRRLLHPECERPLLSSPFQIVDDQERLISAIDEELRRLAIDFDFDLCPFPGFEGDVRLVNTW